MAGLRPDALLSLPANVWERVLMYSALESPQFLSTLSLTCQLFAEIAKEPNFRATYFLFRYNKYLVLHNVYQSFPWMLSFDLADALLASGALLPKFFVERVFRDQSHLHSVGVPQKMPEGTVEFFVARGYKLYKDSLNLGLPGEEEINPTQSTNAADSYDPTYDEETGDIDTAIPEVQFNGNLVFSNLQKPVQSPGHTSTSVSPDNNNLGTADTVTMPPGGTLLSSTNDLTEYEACFLGPVPDVARIRELIFRHSFVPALAAPIDMLSWHDHWGRLIRLYHADPDLALFLARHSGVSPKVYTDSLVVRALRDSRTDIEWFNFFLSRGNLTVAREAVVDVLTSKDFPLSTNATSTGGSIPALDLLREVLEPYQLQEYVENAVRILFREGVPRSIREADFLITDFALPEDAVGRALLVSPYEMKPRRKKGVYRVPAMTVFAQSMSDLATHLNRNNAVLGANDIASGMSDIDHVDNYSESGALASSSTLKRGGHKRQVSQSANSYFSIFSAPKKAPQHHGGGIRDCLWQLILGRYGPDHPFTQACLMDLLLGGTIPTPQVRPPHKTEVDYSTRTKTVQQLSVLSMSSLSSYTTSAAAYPRAGTPSSVNGSSSNFFGLDNPDEITPLPDHEEDRRDILSRNAFGVLMEAGVQLEPNMFAIVTRTIFHTRSVRPRHLEFLAKIERGLLGLDTLLKSPPAGSNHSNSSSNLNPPTSPLSPTPSGGFLYGKALNSASGRQSPLNDDASESKRRWSKVRWVAALRRMVLDDREWKAIAKPHGTADPHVTLSDHELFTPDAQRHSPPPTSPTHATPPNQKGWWSGLSESVLGIMSEEERGNEIVRRFYGCVEDLVTLLGAPQVVLQSVLSAAVSQHHQAQMAAAAAANGVATGTTGTLGRSSSLGRATPAPEEGHFAPTTTSPVRVPPPAVGPFSRWLAEIDRVKDVNNSAAGAAASSSWADFFKGIVGGIVVAEPAGDGALDEQQQQQKMSVNRINSWIGPVQGQTPTVMTGKRSSRIFF
ncbi:hypothetical protein BJ742DRAFT_285357 [Cladochytrium replicatum]|nr:hypothetical protein BJ742DRAFT_285357 [Cladochytrium replicatum]